MHKTQVVSDIFISVQLMDDWTGLAVTAARGTKPIIPEINNGQGKGTNWMGIFMGSEETNQDTESRSPLTPEPHNKGRCNQTVQPHTTLARCDWSNICMYVHIYKEDAIPTTRINKHDSKWCYRHKCEPTWPCAVEKLFVGDVVHCTSWETPYLNGTLYIVLMTTT